MSHSATDTLRTCDKVSGQMAAGAVAADTLRIIGRFEAVCRDASGQVLWQDVFFNTVVATGKGLLLDQGLAGSAYTAAEFMGLISNASFSAIAVGDTQASHAGWLESGGANAPTMSSTRQTCAWSAATGTTTSTKALSAGLTFTFTGPGTVQGAFIVGGTGAVSTVGSTAGILFAAATLTTPQPVIATNTLTVSYSVTLN